MVFILKAHIKQNMMSVSFINVYSCTHCADDDDHQHTGQWENSNGISMSFILLDKRQHDENSFRGDLLNLFNGVYISYHCYAGIIFEMHKENAAARGIRHELSKMTQTFTYCTETHSHLLQNLAVGPLFKGASVGLRAGVRVASIY